MNYKPFKTFVSTLLISIPFSHTALLASDVKIAQNEFDKIETISKKKINKNGRLIVKFCDKLKNYSGFVEANNTKFFIKDADVIKPKKIVWKNTNLPKIKGNAIDTTSLFARYEDEGSQEPLKMLDNGDCGVGFLPLILIGAGIAAGAGGSGGSGSSSSN